MAVTINSAESNRATMRYIVESLWGTTPGSGTSKTMRITKSDLVVSKDTTTSEEIRADRMVPSIIELAAMTGGSVEWEGSAGSQDDMFEQFLLGTWSKTKTYFQVKGTAVAVTGASQITVSGADWTGWLAGMAYVKLEGFTALANNGYFTVSGSAFTSGNTVITVSETSLVAEAGTAFTKVTEANDVILKSTTASISAGNVLTASAGAFSAVVPGQTVYIEGLGKETGTIQAAVTDPISGETIAISDGVDTVIFEVNNSAAAVQSGNVYVPLSGTPNTMATSLRDAINAQFAKAAFRVSATVATDTVTLTNHRATGGSIVEASLGFTTTAFSGGSATKSGFYKVLSVSSNGDALTMDSTLTADTNVGAKTVIVKGSHLRNPGTVSNITKRSLSMETGFTDVDKYFNHRGMRTGAFKLEIKAGAKITGSFEFKGRDTSTGITSVLGSGSYTALDTTSTEVWTATANVGNIKKDGVAISSALTEITLEGSASLREQKAVSSKFPAGVGYGRFTLKGKLVAYFDSFTNYQTFINHATTSLAVPIEDVDHNYYIFSLPTIKMTSDPIAPGGIDQDVMEEIEFNAQRDPTLKTQFMIDRFSSVFPFSA